MTVRCCSQVALLVDTATDWGRQIIYGIERYARQQGGWNIWLQRRCQYAPGRLPHGWRGDGIIARVADRRTARYLAETPGPVVNVSSACIPGARFPTVTADLRAAARLAVYHFFDQGFRHFGYCAPLGFSYAKRHYDGFVEALADIGLECSLFRARQRTGPVPAWEELQKDLRRWIRGLPKPAAVLTWTSDHAREVIYGCRAIGLLVPEQVAVMGGSDDRVLCETCDPPLSAVALPSEQIGYEAAALLDRLLQGKPSLSKRILIEPTRVVARQSTDTLAIEDDDLTRAIAFIRVNASMPIHVGDVLRAVAVSRSWLERRFQEVLGRSPAEEIRRIRLERTKQLLAETDMPVPQVASSSGFGSREYLDHAFKQATGLTPCEFRKRAHGR